MSNDQHDNADALLARHVAALRDEPVPDGPPPETVAATLAKLRLTDPNGIETKRFVTGRTTPIERLVRMTLTQRIAATVLITLGGLTLYVMFTLFSSVGATVAFAQVADKLSGARTLSFTSTTTVPGQPSTSIRTFMTGPDRVRSELPGGSVSIVNGHRIVTLHPGSKTAIRTELTGVAPRPPGGGVVESLRGLGAAKGEPLGEKTIDGIPTVGFRSLVGNRKLTVWADEKTAMPVRVEMPIAMADGEVVVVMDRFVIDAPLDDALFSLDIPADFKVTTQTFAMPAQVRPEEAVAQLLRAYAEATGGAFPASLTDWVALFRTRPDGTPHPGLEPTTIGALSGQLFSLNGGYGYAGKDVKLGEKDKVVFWYRPDPDAATYRALFGDLQVGDVTADKLPAAQQ